jgi:hypothetical protein
MSHHYSGPDFGFPHWDARLDFTDAVADIAYRVRFSVFERGTQTASSAALMARKPPVAAMVGG